MVKQAVTSTGVKLDRDKLEQDSALFWSISNIRLPKGMSWDFGQRAWQTQIFDDKAEDLVVLKPTQVGMTTVMLCKMLHFATYHNVRAMYTLPRQDDVYDLVNGRLESMISDSPVLSSRIGMIDNVRLKTYGSSYLHFMESSVTPRMLDVDILVNDEVDMSNQDNLEQYIARLDASAYNIKYRISTPTVPGFGISALYELSDQKRWLVKCTGCNHYQELNWDRNIMRSRGEIRLSCEKCSKTITPEDISLGRWVAMYPSRTTSGYSVSQLMTTSIPLERLAKDYDSMRPKNFYNLRLGQPFSQESTGFSKDTIIEKCFNSGHSKTNSGSGLFIGADQGNDIHVVVARKNGAEYQIVYLDIIPLQKGFDELEALFYRFNARKMVIDGLPNRHSALSLVNKLPAGRARVVFYTRMDQYIQEMPGSPQVNANRSISFDLLHEKITQGQVQFYGTRMAADKMTRVAMSHLTNIKRQEVRQKLQIGGEKIEMSWINTGADHFAHALNYMLIAGESSGNASFKVVNMDAISPTDNNDYDPRNNNPYYQQQSLLQQVQRKRRIFGR